MLNRDFLAYRRIEQVWRFLWSSGERVGVSIDCLGLFAADTLRDVKPTRQALISVPALSPQYRANGSKNLLLATAEQNHHQLQQYILSSHEIQQYYPLHASSATAVDTANYSRPTTAGIRNGFRPSAVRRQNMRLMTASAQRSGQLDEMKETSAKQPFVPSHASARLRSEIEQISNQLKRHGDSAKPVRDPLGRVSQRAVYWSRLKVSVENIINYSKDPAAFANIDFSVDDEQTTTWKLYFSLNEHYICSQWQINRTMIFLFRTQRVLFTVLSLLPPLAGCHRHRAFLQLIGFINVSHQR